MQSFGVSTRWVLQDENYFTTFRIRFLMESGERDFILTAVQMDNSAGRK